jgi:hypothetical protein
MGLGMHNPTREFLAKLAEICQRKGPRFDPLQWLLDNGLEFTLGPLPKGVRPRAPKACYRNSLQLATRKPDRYVYCEGMATAETLTTEHAWCYDRETGLIVDPTWQSGEFYFGVAVRTSHACEVCVCKNGYESVLWDWMNGYPIMKGTVPETVWREEVPLIQTQRK